MIDMSKASLGIFVKRQRDRRTPTGQIVMLPDMCGGMEIGIIEGIGLALMIVVGAVGLGALGTRWL
jgi:hypothetical protein